VGEEAEVMSGEDYKSWLDRLPDDMPPEQVMALRIQHHLDDFLPPRMAGIRLADKAAQDALSRQDHGAFSVAFYRAAEKAQQEVSGEITKLEAEIEESRDHRLSASAARLKRLAQARRGETVDSPLALVQVTQGALPWQTERPTAQGYYWVRVPGERSPTLVEFSGSAIVAVMGWRHGLEEKRIAQWSGPVAIQRPEP
jgi:hypothetical protein